MFSIKPNQSQYFSCFFYFNFFKILEMVTKIVSVYSIQNCYLWFKCDQSEKEYNRPIYSISFLLCTTLHFIVGILYFLCYIMCNCFVWAHIFHHVCDFGFCSLLMIWDVSCGLKHDVLIDAWDALWAILRCEKIKW